jgi:hypothetical protein
MRRLNKITVKKKVPFQIVIKCQKIVRTMDFNPFTLELLGVLS